MKCSTCSRDVPDGLFCTVCGGHQMAPDQPGGGGIRLHHFAAHPGEHVLHPGMFTTLFPHLGQQKVHEFRWGFLIGVAAIVCLFAFGLISAALLVSIFLLPALYLLYLVEAEVYRDEPVTVLGLTLGGGLIVGLILTLITDWLIEKVAGQQVSSLTRVAGVGAVAILVPNVVIPVIQEIVKPIPALALRGRPKFRETVDGLVFGVAAGFGFSVGETLIRFWPVLSRIPVHVDPAAWLSVGITLGLLRVLLQGTTTGVITAAIWRLGRGRSGSREIWGIAAAFAGHIAFDLVSVWLVSSGADGLVVLAWQAAIDGALLIYVRYLLHHALLDEGSELGFSQTVCPNCQRQITAAGFCPHCGKALSAAPSAVRQTLAPAAADAAASTTEAS